MAISLELLIDTIRKILPDRPTQDSETFLDKRFDALIDGNAYILTSKPNPGQISNTNNQQLIDNNLDSTLKSAARDNNLSEKLTTSLPEMPKIEAPDAWI